MSSLYQDLSWLPPPPAEFNQLCRSVPNQPEKAGSQIRSLASTALDENQLVRLSRVIRKLRASDCSLAPLTEYRLAILSNATTEFFPPVLTGTAARHGLALECIATDYGQVMQESL